MSNLLRIFNTILLCLALVLTFYPRPAEGFTLYEQRESIAAPLPQLKSEIGQVIIDLSGTWEYRIGEKGPFRQGWIPCSFEGNDGIVTFRRSFTLADSLKAYQIQLHLPEVHYAVEVWVNGVFVSSFTGSHLAFSSLIPRDRLRFRGSNDLELRVDSRLTARTTFPVRTQLLHPRNYGGIFSGVYLRAVPSWSLEEASLNYDAPLDTNALNATVDVRIAQYKSPAGSSGDSSRGVSGVRVHAALRDTLGRLLTEGWSERITQGGSESFRISVKLPRTAISLWMPNRPILYQLTATLVAGSDTLQRLSLPVGFKSVSVKGSELLVNGLPLQIRGMDYIPEHLNGRRAISATTLRQDLTRIRDLGMNTIRVPFGPPPLALLNTADSLGLLVFAEANVDWIPTDVFADAAYRDLVQHSLTRMLSVCREHPSIVAWGIGSQLNWRDQAARDFTLWLRGLVKEKDPRPCYIESSFPAFSYNLTDILFIAAASHDGRIPEPIQFGSQPILLSRIGKLAAMGIGNSSNTSAQSVEQAEYIIRELGRFESNHPASGFLIHSFSDYHGSSPLLMQPDIRDNTLYTYGVMSWDRHERISYTKLRDLAQTGQSSPPAPARGHSAPPIAFPVVGLAALLLLSVEMRRNNVFRQNLKRAFLHAHGFHSDLRYRRFLHTAQPLLLWVLEAITLAILSASFLYALRESFALDYYLSHFLPWPRLKAWLVDLIWKPGLAVTYLTGLMMALIMMKTVAVRLTSILFREHVDFWQSANYVIWSFAALLFLLPLAVIFYRVIEMPGLSKLVFWVVVAGLAWCAFRMLSALKTGFGSNPIRVYGTLLGIGFGIAIIIVALLDSQLGTFTYLPFFRDVFVAR